MYLIQKLNYLELNLKNIQLLEMNNEKFIITTQLIPPTNAIKNLII